MLKRSMNGSRDLSRLGRDPGEVKRRAAGLTLSFPVTREDGQLQEACGDGSYGSTLTDHLRQNNGEGLKLSQCRFTSVVIASPIHKLAGATRYGDFFVETDKIGPNLIARRRFLTSVCRFVTAERLHSRMRTPMKSWRKSASTLPRAVGDLSGLGAVSPGRCCVRASERDILRRLRYRLCCG